MDNINTALIAVIVGLVSATIAHIVVSARDRYKANLKIQQLQDIIDSKAKSSTAQRSTIKGQLAEQFFPLMGTCEYEPSDMRFMGDFCDYIVIDGYTQCKDEGHDYINNIVFVEIKTGKAQLSRHQKLIRDAVQQGRVQWSTVRL